MFLSLFFNIVNNCYAALSHLRHRVSIVHLFVVVVSASLALIQQLLVFLLSFVLRHRKIFAKLVVGLRLFGMVHGRVFVYTLCDLDQLLNRYSIFSPLLIFDHLHTLYKLILEAILSLYGRFNDFNDSKSQSHTSKFLLAPYESQNFSDIGPRKGVDEKRDEPLKNPQLIRNVQISDPFCERWRLLLEHSPKNLAIKSHQWELIFIYSNQHKFGMVEYGLEGVESLDFIHPYKYKVTSHKVHPLNVPQPWEVKGNHSQKILKGQLVLGLIELSLERIGPIDIFFDLREGRVRVVADSIEY